MIRKTPLEDWISGKMKNAKTGYLSKKVLDNYHLSALRKVIAYAREKSPFYHSLLADFPSETITKLSDMEKLPFTVSADIRKDPFSFLCVPQGDICRVITLMTSGTRGASKRLFFTVDDIALTVDFFCVGMSTLVKPGQNVLILLPGERPDSVGDLLARGLKRLGVQGIIHGPVYDVKSTIEKIIKLKIDSIVGIPTQVLTLARSSYGSAIKKGMIKSVLLTTDYVPTAIIYELNHLWGCSVFNHYGMTEMGLGGGVDCDAHAGYHLREADLYFEVVDPKTGRVLDNGQIGEVVFTTLTRKGMPLIRYRTGDIAQFIPEPCPCGTVLRRMDYVKGRFDGIVSLNNKQTLMLAEIDEVLFRLPWLLNYHIRLTTIKSQNCIEVAVYADPKDMKRGDEVIAALMKIGTVSLGFKRGSLKMAPVQFVREDWFTTGVGKRQIVIDEGFMCS